VCTGQSLLCLGDSNVVLDWLRYSASKKDLLVGADFRSTKNRVVAFCPVLCDIPNVCDIVSKFFNLSFDVVWVNGVVHAYKYYSIISFPFRFELRNSARFSVRA
jgi:hypothetical protein